MVNARDRRNEPTKPNWWILGGSLAFVLFTLTVGFGGFSYSEEIVFAGSMAIVLFLMARLMRELEPDKRFTLVGTAVVVFIFRAIPGTGPGTTWWMIDQLKFDQQFLSVLSLIGSTLTLAGMFVFRRFMAERSIAYVVGFLTVIGTILTLPIVSMFYGLHEWTARMTGGVVDARFIALIDTALESPLGQISMIPMLAWIANSAPANLKATFFAVMASFTNLALSLSQLGTKYLNEIYVVRREVRDQASGAIQTPADYSQLGSLLIAQLLPWVWPSLLLRSCLPRSPASKARDGSAAIADPLLRQAWPLPSVARPTGSSLSPCNVPRSTPRSCAPPRVGLATRLCDSSATNRRWGKRSHPISMGENHEIGWESDLHAGFVLAIFGTLVMGACGSAQLRKRIKSMIQARKRDVRDDVQVCGLMVWITSGPH